MKRLVLVVLPIVLAVNLCRAAEIKPAGAVAVQITKNSAPGDRSPLVSSWVRVEPKLSATTDDQVQGLIHLRFQPNMGASNLSALLRQGYFELPVAVTKLKAGRWYEAYTPGAYFGRYLFGVGSRGNGSMCTNYNVVDGLRLQIPLVEQLAAKLHLAYLPQDVNWQSQRLMARFSAKLVEMLSIDFAGNLETMKPDIRRRIHRFAATLIAEAMKDLNVFAEYGITDHDNIGENSWVLAGFTLPTAGIMDETRLEFEYNRDRLGTDTDGDFAWMVILTKKAAGLKFNLNVGADPQSLASQGPGDIGFHFRTSVGL